MNKWIVAKFGGSSVKDASAMLRVSQIVENNPLIKVVVISATQNTTNQLEFISKAAVSGDKETLDSLVNELVNRHIAIGKELFTSPDAFLDLEKIYAELRSLTDGISKEKICPPKMMDQIYSIGERISSLLVADLFKLRMANKKTVLLDARKVIKTNSDFHHAEPQIDLIAQHAREHLNEFMLDDTVIVTQGFIGEDLLGNTTTLGREGSDYSAALFGEAIDASLVQIWTDVAGVASSDPRHVKEAKFISKLSYDEATALASLGAKVLFPTTLAPTKRKDIPVFVGSSLDHKAGGTTITKDQDSMFSLKAVSLLQKKEYCIVSFVGVNLENEHRLVDDLKGHFSGMPVEFYDLTSVSVSFKIMGPDKNSVLLKAHDILVEHYLK
jgi:aspartate kinase